MDMRPHLDRLLKLREDRNAWGMMRNRQRLNAKLGDVLILIDHNGQGDTLWQVEVPTEERVIQNWTPANGIAHAMRESVDFTRAYLLSQHEHAHAE